MAVLISVSFHSTPKMFVHMKRTFVNPMTSHTNKTSRNGHICSHLSHGVVDQSQHTCVYRVRKEQAPRTTLDQAIRNRYECRGTNRATNSHQLDLTIAEMSAQLVDIIDMANLIGLVAVDAVRRGVCRLLVDSTSGL